jgi:hypothetical protein
MRVRAGGELQNFDRVSRAATNGQEKIMSIDEVQEYVESHDENIETPHDDLVEMFRTVYDREPDEEDIREGLWSHICAGVEHDGSGSTRMAGVTG